MKKTQLISTLIVGASIFWVFSGAITSRERTDFHVQDFARLPVLLNGRIQPLDSVARNLLLALRGTQTMPPDKGESSAGPADSERLSAAQWLLELLGQSDKADRRRVFRLHHPDLLQDLNLPKRAGKLMQFYSYEMLEPGVEALQKEMERIARVEPALRSGYENEIARLHFTITLYRRLKNSLQPEGTKDFPGEIENYQTALARGLSAFQRKQAGEQYETADLQLLAQSLRRYQTLSQIAYPLVIPPTAPGESDENWANVGTSLLESARTCAIHPAVQFFAAMISAYQSNNALVFNQALGNYGDWLNTNISSQMKAAKGEFMYNQLQLFQKCLVLYVVVFILTVLSWLNDSHYLGRAACHLSVLAFAIHSVGLVFRMILHGRPPVTNLYSSAVFVGWGAVGLGLVLERLHRQGIGTVTAAAIGFMTLLVAHYLSLQGDTLEMLRAVLDTNAWLATHVVIINLGYSATYVAGCLAAIYLLRNSCGGGLPETLRRSLSRMVYGITCFAIFFSFVGTVLGAIWADQSWGRFWGWDPKENGALMIVLWNAVILHARWGGLVQERGLMVMAVFGNVITSWSYFGVNSLGVGLHAYGFTEASFLWLMTFVASQLLIMTLGLRRSPRINVLGNAAPSLS
jgi:ABC-type transport system involved in cytochrome c biogenesis permease subunit